jgi:sugar porter (SP) family MFS transporter
MRMAATLSTLSKCATFSVSEMSSTADLDAPDADPPMVFGRFRLWLCMVTVVVVLAGVLFGYDQGVISGALDDITKEFHLSTFMQEVVTSWVTLGALFGALIAGSWADKRGRINTLIAASILFAIGGVFEAIAQGTFVLVIGRFTVGFGVGAASVAAPLYAAELAPKQVRGRFVSSYQLAITIGILLADVVDAALSESGRWRLMLGLSILPAVLLVLVVVRMPESPRWLVKMGRGDEARQAMAQVQGGADIDGRVAVIEEELAEEANASWNEVFSIHLRRALWVGILLAVFQQITGINAVIYYSDKIFALAGFTSPAAQTHATLIAVGLVNVLATLIAVAWVDRFGRKPLLFSGLIGMTVALVAIGAAFAFLEKKPEAGGGASVVGLVTLLAMVVYIASFAFSLGPVVWTMINEIFPNRVRGKAVAFCTAVNWGAAFVVSATFLSLIDLIGEATTFFLFAAMCVVAFVWVRSRVPETKGKSLEEIQAVWEEHDRAQRAPKTLPVG